MHSASGMRPEANCYAVQLVYPYAKALRFTNRTASRLGQLALRYIPAWFPAWLLEWARCRDDGEWDLSRYPEPFA